MEVLLLTMFFSLLLAAFFVMAFWWNSQPSRSNPDRDSLLPLAEETAVPAKKGSKPST